MDREATADEKLLKLIRKSDKPGGLPDRGSEKKTKVENSSPAQKQIDIFQLVNFLLIAIVVVLAVYIGKRYALAPANQGAVLNEPGAVAELKVKDDVVAASPFSLYQADLSSRNFFQYPWEKPQIDEVAVRNVVNEIRSQYRLVGVMLDNEPQAIIEDLRSQQTYFVSRGGPIGEAVLEDVQEGKAVLLYNGERIELVP